MSGLLSLLRPWSRFRHRRPLRAQRLEALCASWVSLALAPLSASAQAAPITIGVQIGGTPTLLGSRSGRRVALASLPASGLASGLVYNQLVLPEALTTIEKTSAQARAAPQLLQRPRTVGGMFRYEHIHLHQGVLDLDGNSYATNRRHANLALSLHPGGRRCGELPQPHAEEGGRRWYTSNADTSGYGCGFCASGF